MCIQNTTQRKIGQTASCRQLLCRIMKNIEKTTAKNSYRNNARPSPNILLYITAHNKRKDIAKVPFFFHRIITSVQTHREHPLSDFLIFIPCTDLLPILVAYDTSIINMPLRSRLLRIIRIIKIPISSDFAI